MQQTTSTIKTTTSDMMAMILRSTKEQINNHVISEDILHDQGLQVHTCFYIVRYFERER